MSSEVKILLAEDNEVNQHLMMRILSRIGYDATLAKNGIQVLNKLDKEDFDVVLMDIQMPEMDGITAAKLIRMHYPAEKQPKIVALTAAPEDSDKYLMVGMNAVLTKPVQIDALIDILEKFSGRTGASGEGSLPPKKSSSLNEFPTFEVSVIEEFKNLMGEEGADAVGHLIDLYKAGTPDLIAKIESSFAQKDAEELLKLLHTLKGSSSQVGARRMEQLCARLETLVKQSGIEPFGTFIPGIKQEFIDLSKALDEYRTSV